MALMKREERAKRNATSKGVPNGRCVQHDYFKKVVGQITLPNGRLANVVRGYSKYLHVTKGWRKRAVTGLKLEPLPL